MDEAFLTDPLQFGRGNVIVRQAILPDSSLSEAVMSVTCKVSKPGLSNVQLDGC